MGSRGRSVLNKGQWGAVAIAAVILLALSFVFGGASRQNALRLALVELAALPVLVLAANRMLAESAIWERHRFALILAGLTIALPLAQLIPLPPALWQALPGRDDLSLALSLTGTPPGWSSWSLTPDPTWRDALGLIPPLAMFGAVLTVPAQTRERLIWLCLAAGVLGITLAAGQLASGNTSLYPWSWTDRGLAVGFFANRNHMAALCTSTLPFAIALAFGAARDRSASRRRLWLGLIYVGLAIIAIAAIRSRAGVLLAFPALGAGISAAWIASGRGRPSLGLLTLSSVSAVATTIAAVFALSPIMDRFDVADLDHGRIDRWPAALDAAQRYLPFGSGFGSFDTVFRSVEPLEQLDATYFNAAHNDFLQIWLESGWFGAALLVAFFVWYGRRVWSVWRSVGATTQNLERAASIAIALIVAHSVVDYPLRTESIAVLFALCCGILEMANRNEPARTGSDHRNAQRPPHLAVSISPARRSRSKNLAS